MKKKNNSRKQKGKKCAVCGRFKGVIWSIYSTATGKIQCTMCANEMRSGGGYIGRDLIYDSPADPFKKERDRKLNKKWYEFWV